ncbi:LLM class flavin-dependent oxidoreductase [Bacillus kexueae]|uniref:LLM class flavin-dependent oxidoreductase n=1 Tax=Aeribacillus kexueae TaxID=2078952 RepID=UPI001FAF7617|nr:LLM class flavin-dependent oxidoreductase [Bacillus kexueae]
MEIGIYTFGERTADPETGRLISPMERLQNMIEEMELADQVGLDVYGIGEHHRPDYTVSAPSVVLAAGGSRTKRIRLTSAVNVLSSDDPVRVFQQFATLDLLTKGRAEIMVGRGSFIESFPLFGYDLKDYDKLFEEKLDLLLKLRESERVTWTGTCRSSIENLGVYPRPMQNPLPLWIAVGGTPESAKRTGSLGLPMALAIIGGFPERFKPLAEIHQEAAINAGHKKPKLSINSHGFLADSSQEAAKLAYPAFKTMMDRLGRERGWPPMTQDQYDFSLSLRGANFIGSPEQIIEKILFQYEIFKHDRFLLQLTVGTLPHKKVLRALELLGTKVAPVIKREISRANGK